MNKEKTDRVFDKYKQPVKDCLGWRGRDKEGAMTQSNIEKRIFSLSGTFGNFTKRTAFFAFIVMAAILCFGGSAHAWDVTYNTDGNGILNPPPTPRTQTVPDGNDSITITAQPNLDPDYVFNNWTITSGAGSATFSDLNTAALDITNVLGDVVVQANFVIDTHTVTFNAGAGGTVTGTAPQTIDDMQNCTTVTATPGVGPDYTFVNWTITSGGTNATFSDLNTAALDITIVEGDVVVQANFAIVTHTVTFNAGAGGTVTGTTPQTIDDMQNCSTVTATPNTDPDYVFVNWTITSGGTNATFSDLNTAALDITIVEGDVVVQANFTIVQHTVTFTIVGNGTLTGTTTQTVDDMQDCTTVTATPNTLTDPQNHFVSWTIIAGNPADAVYVDDLFDNTLDVTVVRGDLTIQANIQQDYVVSIDDQTVSEEAGTVTFTVSLLVAVVADDSATVNYMTNNGDAVAGSDYTATSGTLVFAPAEQTKTIIVDITNDTDVEDATELFYVDLSAGTNTSFTGGDDRGTCFLEDNDYNLSITNNSEDENGGSGLFTISLDKVVLNGTVTANYAAADGVVAPIATVLGDLDAGGVNGTSGSYIFSTGEQNVDVYIDLFDDIVVEYDETYLVNVSGVSSISGTINSATGTGTITNDDTYGVTITGRTRTEPEPTAALDVFDVVLNQAVLAGQIVRVNVGTSDDTALNGDDYTGATQEVSFDGDLGEGLSTKAVPITILADTLYEISERFNGTLSDVSGNTNFLVPTATCTIDDDNDTFDVIITGQTVGEPGADAYRNAFDVALDQAVPLGQTVTVDVNLTAGSATGADYNDESPYAVVFTEGEGTAEDVMVQILTDGVYEGDETFDGTVSTLHASASITTDTSTCTITDDGDTCEISIAGLTVTEQAADTYIAAFNVNLDQVVPPAQTVTVNVDLTAGTAADGNDYDDESTYAVSFAAGEDTQQVLVEILADSLFEIDETFTGTLSGESPNAVLDAGASTATCTIQDNGDQCGVTITGLTVTEPGGNENINAFEVVLDQAVPAGETITVDVITSPGTADAGADYAVDIPVPPMPTPHVTFTEGQGLTAKPVQATILADNTVEHYETFTGTLTNLDADAYAISGSAECRILDDGDKYVISISDAAAVNEDPTGQQASFTVTINQTPLAFIDAGRPAHTVDVDASTINNTALGGQDFVTKTETLTFTDPSVSPPGPGPGPHTVLIDIMNDAIPEDPVTENFLVRLVSPSANAVISGTDDEGTCIITDRDFTITASTTKDGSMTMTATGLTSPASGYVIVEESTNVEINVDYASGTEDLTFALSPDYPDEPQGYNPPAMADGGGTWAHDSGAKECTLTNATADGSISVEFDHQITVSAGSNGNVCYGGTAIDPCDTTPSYVIVSHNSNAAFTISPDTGYCVKRVLAGPVGGAVSVGSPTSYTFNTVEESKEISAEFRDTSLTVYILPDNGTTAIPADCTGDFNGTFDTDPEVFGRWQIADLGGTPLTGELCSGETYDLDTGDCNVSDIQVQFTPVGGYMAPAPIIINITEATDSFDVLEGTYTPLSFSLTLLVEDLAGTEGVGGSISPDPEGGADISGVTYIYDRDTEVTLSPSADPGYVFLRWEGDVTGTTNPETIIINGDKVVTAVFTTACTDADNDGYCVDDPVPANVDCADDNPNRHPGRYDTCGDGIDQDCDGSDADCGISDDDNDSDGFSPMQGDCDDTNSNMYPGNIDVCGNGVDEDCYDGDRTCGTESLCVDIEDAPLAHALDAAAPLIMFVLDDSGSMDWTIMTRESDGLFDDERYVFDDPGDHNGSRILDTEQRKRWTSQWRSYNRMYYDPNVTYEPWPRWSLLNCTDGYGAGLNVNADPDSPRSNPVNSGNTFNLNGDEYLTLSQSGGGGALTEYVYVSYYQPCGTYDRTSRSLRADAVLVAPFDQALQPDRFTENPTNTVLRVDNSDAGFSLAGQWSTGNNGAEIGPDYRYTRDDDGGTWGQAWWDISNVPGGVTYDVYVWVPYSTYSVRAAPYETHYIDAGDNPQQVNDTVDQRGSSERWVKIADDIHLKGNPAGGDIDIHRAHYYVCLWELDYDNVVTGFTVGSYVVGADSGAVARITDISGGTLELAAYRGEFIDNETITSASGGEALANGTAVTKDVFLVNLNGTYAQLGSATNDYHEPEVEIYQFVNTDGNDADGYEQVSRDELTLLDPDEDDDEDIIEKIWPRRNDLDGDETSTFRTAQEERQNFANWFSFYRRRELAGKAAVSKIIEDLSGVKVGLHTIQARINQEVVPVDLDGNDETETLLKLLYNLYSSSGTPLRRGLDRAGRYFRKGDSDNAGIGASPFEDDGNGGGCQRAFCLLMTDGYYNGTRPSKWYGNADSDGNDERPDPPTGTKTFYDKDVFTGPGSNTLADIAMYYYENDLAPNTSDEVPNYNYDEAPHQHMITYGISFGVTGNFNPVDYPSCLPKCEPGTFGCPVPCTEGDTGCDASDPNDGVCPDWEEPTNNQRKIDDLYHASVNGRGRFFSASNPVELVDALTDVMNDIINQTGSGASVAINAQELRSDTVIFQALYNTGNWSGDLVAKPLDETGRIIQEQNPQGDFEDKILWSAADELDNRAGGWTTRKIISIKYDDPGAGDITPIVFDYTEMSGAQRSLMNSDPTIVNFLRGDRSNEQTRFRVRESVLGDIVHSSPLVTGDLVIAGGNDGMVHVFDQDTATEIFAYVPNLVYKYLEDLAAEGASVFYSHKYFVDATPTAKDIIFGSLVGRTYVVGGLKKGGRGYYCLDVTGVTTATNVEDNPGNYIKWEYPQNSTNPDTSPDPDMGFSFSQAYIVGSNATTEEIVIFGNGYDSTNGHAVLYILNVTDGSLIKKIDTGVGGNNNTAYAADACNGLSTPTLIDFDLDGKVDYAYAGDLLGNLWKFDLTGTSTAAWDVAYKDGATPKPLFQAMDSLGNRQPITIKPDVMRHCKSNELGYIVAFGTGRFISLEDFDDGDNVQTIYGIWDWADSWEVNGHNVSERNSENKYMGEFETVGGVRRLSNLVNNPNMPSTTVIVPVVNFSAFSGEVGVSVYVNGTEFVSANLTDTANREFSSPEGFALCINDLINGLSDARAFPSGTSVTIKAYPPGGTQPTVSTNPPITWANETIQVGLLQQVVRYYGWWRPHDDVNADPVQLIVVSDFSMDWFAISTGEGRHVGWYYDLPGTSERVTNDVMIVGRRLIVVPIIPSRSPCSAGGDSWVYIMNACSGGRMDTVQFDLDEDRALTETDETDIGLPSLHEWVAPTATKKEGLIVGLTMIEDVLILTDASGDIETDDTEGAAEGIFYWREIN